jgi:hypothetical protein
MKLVKLDGRLLRGSRGWRTYLYIGRQRSTPRGWNGWRIVEDDAARDLVRELASAQKVVEKAVS